MRDAQTIVLRIGLVAVLALLAAWAQPPAGVTLSFRHEVVDKEGPLDIWLKTVGDLNGDGRPDLIAGGYKEGGLVWYENPSWTKHVIAATGNFSTDGEVVDVDRDGDKDVVALTKDQIVWLENPAWTPHVIGRVDVHDIEVADLDGDGRVDVVGRNQGAFSSHGDKLFLFRQETADKWSQRTVEIPDGEGIVLADIDRDKDPDVIINRLWLENPGDILKGDWTRHEYGPKWEYPHTFVAAGDLNGDGRPDIVLAPAEKAGGTYRISWFEAPRNSRTGAWKEHVVEQPVETVHHYVGTADFDGDRRTDIVTARMQQGKNPEIAVYLNAGAGKRWAKQVVAPVSSHSMRVVDVDGDGRPDLYGANWRGSRTVELWRNVAGSAFRVADDWRFEHAVLPDFYTEQDAMSGESAIVDINGDGHPDIWFSAYAFARSASDRGRYERHKDLSQMAWYKGPDFKQMFRMHRGVTHGGIWYDVDGDGDLDCITGLAIQSREVVWLENPGNPENAQEWPYHVISRGEVDPDMILMADIDADGRRDLVIQSFRQDVHYLAMPKDPKQSPWSAIHLGHSEQPRTGASTGDVDNDGDIDIVWGYGWLENPGKGGPAPWKDHIIDKDFHRDAQSVVVDLDYDGKSDIILAGEESFDGLAWYSQGRTPDEWTKHVIAGGQTYSGLHSLAVADFDRDGDLDVFTAEMHASGYIKQVPPHNITIFENVDIRKNSWKEHVLAQTGSHNARVGDLDGDGRPDVVGSNWNNRVQEYPLKAEFWINRIGGAPAKSRGKLALDRWTYIQVDDSRGKWGDFGTPANMKYFGLDAKDVTGDGFLDLISGRYFYRNPGGDMSGRWVRTDLGLNVDAMLFADVDGDSLADCIAEALPDVYWLEAQDRQGTAWKATKVAQLPKSRHVNGQGFAVAQLVPGGKPEIVLSTGEGIYYIEIPARPAEGNWRATLAAAEASEQGLGVGDVDGDGLIDIAAAYGHRVEPKSVAWWKNPGKGGGPWKLHEVGKLVNSADRVAVADINGDRRADIVVTEEWWRTHDRLASLFWFEQQAPGATIPWQPHKVITAGSLNNLSVADMDKDGDLDIVTCEHKGEGERLFLFENTGQGRFTQHVLDKGKESHLGARLYDLDGDGDLDIVSIAWDDYRFLHLWRNDAVPPRGARKK